jgi:hypothetical protein
MITVKIPFVRRGPGANSAIEMSIWCRQQGLVNYTDYSWSFHPDDCEIVFEFYGPVNTGPVCLH